jgi:hypothetical protein
MVNNLTNINKKNNHLSPQIIEHATDQISAVSNFYFFYIFFLSKEVSLVIPLDSLFSGKHDELWYVLSLSAISQLHVFCDYQNYWWRRTPTVIKKNRLIGHGYNKN